MSRATGEALREVGRSTLQALAFLFAAEDPTPPAPVAEDVTTVSLRFTGPFSGHLALTVPASVLALLTANMLGLPPRPTPHRRQQQDAAKELANVICGNLLPVIGGRKAVFHIEPPLLTGDPTLAATDPAKTTSVVVPLEEGWVRLQLNLD